MRRKKIAQALAAAALVITMTMGTAFASYGTGTVTADALRLRSSASTSSTTLSMVYKGSTVELLSAEENGWYKVSYNGTEGYMSADWLQVTVTASSDIVDTGSSADNTVSAQQTAVVKDGPLNVRSGPGTSYERVGSLKKGTEVTILSTQDDWYEISAGSVTGYVSAQYISLDGTVTQDNTVTQDGLVIAGPLNVRSGPGTGYSRVGSLSLGATISVLGSSNGWYQISTGSLTGYVHGDYVALLSDLGSSPVGASAAALAISLVGSPYVYGAEGPNSFDCSGLTYYIYKQLGYTIARGSSSQYKNSGYFVTQAQLEPGDLVFFFDPRFDSSGGTLPTTHMGIYVGNGQFIHASTTSYKVQYDDLFNSYYTKYIVGYKRIA